MYRLLFVLTLTPEVLFYRREQDIRLHKGYKENYLKEYSLLASTDQQVKKAIQNYHSLQIQLQSYQKGRKKTEIFTLATLQMTSDLRPVAS